MLSIARPTLLLLAALIGFARITDAATAGSVSSISSFTVPKSPSGMYYFAAQDLLYILCGTNTNGDHYLYAYTTGGAQRCSVTIPAAVGMSRVDGFQIVGDTAYIVDSQGPIYASTGLGGSLYAVAWSNPCGCDATGACTNAVVTWTPTITKTYTLRASDATIGDGGGVDDVFRNSGVAVVGDSFYAVNGVHPAGPGGLSCCFPKSIVKMPLSGTGTGATRKWNFTASTIGRAVDMEGLTCGADNCADFLYVGDEYNYVYKVRLGTTDPAAAVETEFDLRSIVGSVPEDKGIEALTYSSKTGYFYAGIQETSVVHVVALSDPSSTATSTPTVSVVSGTASPTPTSAVTVPPTPTSPSTLPQTAPQSGSAASAPAWVWVGFAVVAALAVLETI